MACEARKERAADEIGCERFVCCSAALPLTHVTQMNTNFVSKSGYIFLPHGIVHDDDGVKEEEGKPAQQQKKGIERNRWMLGKKESL